MRTELIYFKGIYELIYSYILYININAPTHAQHNEKKRLFLTTSTETLQFRLYNCSHRTE